MTQERRTSSPYAISRDEFLKKLATEGVNYRLVPADPTWEERAPWRKGVKSAVIGGDLLLRSDGSSVILTSWITGDSSFFHKYWTGYYNMPEHSQLVRTWFPEVAELRGPPQGLLHRAMDILGWDAFVERLKTREPKQI